MPADDGESQFDFEHAWGHPHAYAFIKAAIYKEFMKREDFNPENPYEALISGVANTGIIHSAHELRKRIEVKYDWELLDDDNVVMHSCYGLVDKVDIRINAKELGFLMDLGDGEYGAFAYKDIFWICAVED